MRQAGTIDNQADAERLAEYLLTIGISTRVLKESAGWSVWVRDESQVDRAREEITAFAANRTDVKYTAAAPLAKSIKKVEAARETQARRNYVDMRENWRQPALGRMPVVMLLIFLSIFVTLVTNFGSVTPEVDARRAAFLDRMWIADPPVANEPASLDAVDRGEVWRLFTPIFLHFNIMHILFNMMWLYHLGGVIERIEGSWRLALLVAVIAAISNVAQFYFPNIEAYLTAPPGGVVMHPNPFSGGMSGVVYGLFGFVWMRARRDPLSRYFIDDQTVIMMFVWFFICLFGFAGPIANTAHGMGLLVGVVIGYAVAKYRLARLHG